MHHLSINSGATPSWTELDQGLDALPPRAPVVIMTHGLRYCPSDPENDPHQLILSPEDTGRCWKAVSWPQSLNLTDGMTIGFGWSARKSVWNAYHEAPQAARDLAQLVRHIREASPDRPIHMIGHSLGARVILQSLPHVQAGDVQRAVLLSPAEFADNARAALDCPAGRSAEVFSILSRQNTAFDLLLRAAMPHLGATLGRAGPQQYNWLDLRIDHAPSRRALEAFGHRVADNSRRVCHWSGYLRDGVWPFYRDLLTRPDLTPMGMLAAHMAVPDRPDWPVLAYSS